MFFSLSLHFCGMQYIARSYMYSWNRLRHIFFVFFFSKIKLELLNTTWKINILFIYSLISLITVLTIEQIIIVSLLYVKQPCFPFSASLRCTPWFIFEWTFFIHRNAARQEFDNLIRETTQLSDHLFKYKQCFTNVGSIPTCIENRCQLLALIFPGSYLKITVAHVRTPQEQLTDQLEGMCTAGDWTLSSFPTK